MEYTAIVGAAVIISCSTLFCADIAKQIKHEVSAVKATEVYFSKLSDCFATGGDMVYSMEQCASELPSESIYTLLARSIQSTDTSSLSSAWEKCKLDNNINPKLCIEAKYIAQFVSACGNGGVEGYITAAANVSKTAGEDYNQLSGKTKADSKLLMYAGVCAGIVISMLLV